MSKFLHQKKMNNKSLETKRPGQDVMHMPELLTSKKPRTYTRFFISFLHACIKGRIF